ncbi:hypothetical protein EW146_g7096 [Bondarzewia mesenterica]|uniref:Phytocyanin domain-containing protein n=1 Tax=Bondarzewia mesenterica TaxID=1095465 RepID=A0A4S4LSG4_9AGAM|nr:hypothetical protein EW146_g7096 [Bondarzewia mesenterica]
MRTFLSVFFPVFFLSSPLAVFSESLGHTGTHRQHPRDLSRRLNGEVQLYKRFDNAKFTFYDAGENACGGSSKNSDFRTHPQIVALNAAQYGDDSGPNCWKKNHYQLWRKNYQSQCCGQSSHLPESTIVDRIGEKGSQDVCEDVLQDKPKYNTLTWIIMFSPRRSITEKHKQVGGGLAVDRHPQILSNMFTSLKALATASVFLAPLTFGRTHHIVAGQAGALTYTPSNITAAVGDIIEFKFVQMNHSATQTSFDAPCTPIEGGFNSGFNPIAADQTSNFPTFSVEVKDTEPIWVSCQQVGHCHLGMTFAANPTENETYSEFLARAKAS